jgi:hypothetical protein
MTPATITEIIHNQADDELRRIINAKVSSLGLHGAGEIHVPEGWQRTFGKVLRKELLFEGLRVLMFQEQHQAFRAMKVQEFMEKVERSAAAAAELAQLREEIREGQQ